MSDPGYDDTDMTDAEFDRRFAASVPAYVYSSRAESDFYSPYSFAQIVRATSNVSLVNAPLALQSSWATERFIGENVLVVADVDQKLPQTSSGDQPLASVA
ncbi:MAG: hypothetical protein ABSA08_07790 [Acidimicrobiales bacterium]|jgi:hypothetical protein